jgi:hypothetical protein
MPAVRQRKWWRREVHPAWVVTGVLAAWLLLPRGTPDPPGSHRAKVAELEQALRIERGAGQAERQKRLELETRLKQAAEECAWKDRALVKKIADLERERGHLQEEVTIYRNFTLDAGEWAATLPADAAKGYGALHAGFEKEHTDHDRRFRAELAVRP